MAPQTVTPHPNTCADALDRALSLLDTHAQAPGLAELARAIGLSPSHLQRRFRQRFGVSPAEYVRARRFEALKAELREGTPVTQAVYAAGFGSGSRVYEQTDRLLGMTPQRYRRGGAGVDIRHTTVATPLGELLVAATARGICAVMLGDDAPTLAERLGEEFPQARHQRVDAGRDEWLDAVIARVGHDMGWADAAPDTLPPLDVAATAFQWRVWQALTRLPPGRTVSYGELAQVIGEPRRAARAVARACASNRLALIVPCHRVIREDGSLGGYRWGLERKQRVLDHEYAGT